MNETFNDMLKIASAIEALIEVERLAIREVGWGDDPPTIEDCGKVPSLESYVPTACAVLFDLGLVGEAKGLLDETSVFHSYKLDMFSRFSVRGISDEEYEAKCDSWGYIPCWPEDPELGIELAMALKVGLQSHINYVCHRVLRLRQFLDKETSSITTQDHLNAEKFVFAPEGDGFYIASFDESGHFQKSRGFGYLLQLILQAGQPVLATDLHLLRVSGNSIHPIADAETIKGYRKRLREAKYELEEAQRKSDSIAEFGAQEEISTVTSYLQQATTPAGTHKNFSTAATSAKNSVKAAIDRAIKDLRDPMPKTADHFEKSIQFGVSLVYEPSDISARWSTCRAE